MGRRFTIVAAAFAAAVVMPTAAWAANANVQSPHAGGTLSEPQPITVEVNLDAGEAAPSSVEVRLSSDGRSTVDGTGIVRLNCVSGCGGQSSTWSGGSFDPATFAPFGGAQCNGRYFLQPRIDGGAWRAGVNFTVSAAPQAVAGIDTSVDDRSVSLRWVRLDAPDLASYEVERSRDGGPWVSIADLAPTASSYVDRGLTSGQYAYRIVAHRPDGMIDGQPARPCEDSGADLSSVSSARNVAVGEPEPEPTATDDSADGNPDGTTDDSTAGTDDTGDDDGAAASPDPSDGSSTGTTGSSSDDGSDDGGSTGDDTAGSSSSGSHTTVGAPPGPRRSSSLEASDPNLPDAQAPAPQERYYGEDQEYSDTLDYGDQPVIAGEQPNGGDGTVEIVQRRAGGFRQGVVASLDLSLILKPVALGLILVAVALHLRTWMREHDVA